MWGRISLSIDEKQSRLKELSNPSLALSDQEYEEKEKLEEELNMIHKEETENIKENTIDSDTSEINTPRKKRSLLDIVINKLKKKPITYEEIERLQKERTVAYLKRDIAKAKWQRKNPGGKSGSKKRSLKLFDDDKAIYRTAKDFDRMTGGNNKDKYKGLIP